VIEVIYFGFFCFEPLIWPDKTPQTCDIPFTRLTAIYVLIILAVMMPIRIFINKDWNRTHSTVARYYAILSIVHMLLCLAWIVYAMMQLRHSTDTCWDPFTW